MSSSPEHLLHDQDVPDLTDSITKSLVSPAAHRHDPHDSLQELNQADLAVLLPDVQHPNTAASAEVTTEDAEPLLSFAASTAATTTEGNDDENPPRVEEYHDVEQLVSATLEAMAEMDRKSPASAAVAQETGASSAVPRTEDSKHEQHHRSTARQDKQTTQPKRKRGRPPKQDMGDKKKWLLKRRGRKPKPWSESRSRQRAEDEMGPPSLERITTASQQSSSAPGNKVSPPVLSKTSELDESPAPLDDNRPLASAPVLSRDYQRPGETLGTVRNVPMAVVKPQRKRGRPPKQRFVIPVTPPQPQPPGSMHS